MDQSIQPGERFHSPCHRLGACADDVVAYRLFPCRQRCSTSKESLTEITCPPFHEEGSNCVFIQLIRGVFCINPLVVFPPLGGRKHQMELDHCQFCLRVGWLSCGP